MEPTAFTCPECNSDSIAWRSAQHHWTCLKCHNEWEAPSPNDTQHVWALAQGIDDADDGGDGGDGD